MPSDNPLITALGPYKSYKTLPELLRYSYLDNKDVRNFDEQEQNDYLGQIKSLFVPTLSSMEVTYTIQQMIRDSYFVRNPYLVETRKQLYEIGSCAGMKLDELPSFDLNASGYLIYGITGGGKSKELKRALSLFPQVIEHGHDEEAGWKRQKQLVWLYVQVSHDGSRGGQLIEILAAMDEVLNTNYHIELPKQYRTIEKLAVGVGIVLATHYCGLIVFDEAQKNNFYESIYKDILQAFFLKLMNFGIPIIVCGNPLAFEDIFNSSQLTRRFRSEGLKEYLPAEECDDDWNNYMVPGIWEYNVLPEYTELNDEIRHALYMCSGGMRHYLCELVKGAQNIAIRSDSKSLTIDHIFQYYETPAMKLQHNLVNAFISKNSKLLTEYKDIPAEYFKKLWENDEGSSSETKQNDKSYTDDNYSSNQNDVDISRTIKRRKKTEETRLQNKQKKKKRNKKELPDFDLRNGGLENVVVQGYMKISK